VISTGIKRGRATDAVVAGSVETMLTPGKYAAEAMREFGVKAATDVTGFALLGHAWEMACASKVTIEIDAHAVPLLEGALELASEGLLTSGDKTNREYVAADVEIAPSVDQNLVKLLFDPQTAGGMLIAIAEDKAETLLRTLGTQYAHARIIGRVLPREASAIVVRAQD
jgi:selenide,water dikinase